MFQGQLKVGMTWIPATLYLFPDSLAITDTRLTGVGRVLMGRGSVVGKLVQRSRNQPPDQAPAAPADLPGAHVIPHSSITRAEISRKVLGMAQGSRRLHVIGEGEVEFQFSKDVEARLMEDLARALGDRFIR